LHFREIFQEWNLTSFTRVPIESIQAYWDARPCNIRHSPRPVGSREYFDDVEARKYTVEPHIPQFAEFARWRGKRVLEIGCGIGTDTINFARAGAEITAVDLSARSIEVARHRAAVFGVSDRIRFYNANAEALADAVPVEPYDLVYSFGVIHHSPHPDRVVAQALRYLPPGGSLKLMVYHRFSIKVLWIMLTYGRGRFWRLSELVARFSEAQTGCPVTYIYSMSEARRMVEANGFRVTAMSVDHIFPYRIADYVEYRYVKKWYFRHIPDRIFCAFERRYGWHLMIDAVRS
jgi:2-polyprenyl-3-methyl-5-hydroxy-6-metoxy-1,4-benzoquinol methylase